MASAVFITVYNGTAEEIASIPIQHGNMLFDETNNIIYYDNEENERHIYGRSIDSEELEERVESLESSMSSATSSISTLNTSVSSINSKLGNTSYSSKGSTITEALSRVPRLYYGTSTPSSSLGVNGDIYIKTV